VQVSLSLLTIGLTYALSAGVTFALAVYVVLRGDNDRTLQVFGVLLVGIVVWSLALAGQLLTPSIGGKMIWHLVGYLGILTVPPSFLLFALSYTGQSRYISLPSIALLSVEPGFAFVLLATNGAHGLYYRSVGLVSLGETQVLTTSGGPGFWVHAFFAYVFVGLGIVLLVRFALTTERLYRLQVVAIVSGALVPLVVNGVFVVGVSPAPAFDLTPPAFALSSLFIFVGIVHGGFVRLRPVDRETVLGAVDDAILVVDDTDQVIYANPPAESILSGRHRESRRLVGESLSAVLPVVTAAESDRTPTGDGSSGFEASVRRDGVMRWFWVRQVPLGSDALGSTVVVLSDISERKQRRQRSERLQRATRRLLDVEDEQEVADVAVEAAEEVFTLPLSGIYLHDGETDRLEGVEVTDAVVDAFGSTPDYERDGESDVSRLVWRAYEQQKTVVVPDVSESEALDATDTPIRSAVVQPIPRHGVFVLSAREPEPVDETDIALIEVLASTVKGALDQAENRRIRRENETRLKRQNERLEEFTSVVSHDLRSPLNTVNGYLELLDEAYDDHRIARAREATTRMATLVSDLLTLARQGKTVDDTTEAALADAVERAWESIPAPDGSLVVDDGFGHAAVDESRLRQAFENLFRNAVEHGGEGVQIRVGPLADEEGFYVEDDGPGIPPDQRDRVFEHGYTTGDGGTGLGLAIVKRIFGAHGWTVRATEGTGGGARFEVTGVDGRVKRVPATAGQD
jgi:signal transduction histidine kinase